MIFCTVYIIGDLDSRFYLICMHFETGCDDYIARRCEVESLVTVLSCHALVVVCGLWVVGGPAVGLSTPVSSRIGRPGT